MLNLQGIVSVALLWGEASTHFEMFALGVTLGSRWIALAVVMEF